MKKFILLLVLSLVLGIMLVSCMPLATLVTGASTPALPTTPTTLPTVATTISTTAATATAATMVPTSAAITVPTTAVTTTAVTTTATMVPTSAATTTTTTTSVHIHKFVEQETLVKETCTEKGSVRSACECGEEIISEVPALWHNEVIDKGYAATKTQDGLTDGSHCSVCGEIMTEQKICGAGSQGLKYTVLTATTCEITGIGTCTDEDIIIPRYIDGYKVISIGTNAFYNCFSLISVMVPDGVTIIEKHAFYNCGQLTSVTIPDSVKTIEEAAFYACRLTSVTIPESVTNINGNSFLSCWYLTNIVVSKDNTSYKHIDGILFTYDDKKLICYPTGKKGVYAIPESVTSIEEFCFNNCDFLTSVTIPDGVKTIEFATFANCDSLTSVKIPNSVMSIGGAAFSDCTSLTSITYAGTILEWKAIAKNASWDDTTPDYTVYCIDGTITKSGTITYK